MGAVAGGDDLEIAWPSTKDRHSGVVALVKHVCVAVCELRNAIVMGDNDQIV
jgi:hypothetical protein